MADQAQFLDEIVRFGDPWHGLFRGGVLELPNGQTRSAAAPPNWGDCFDVVVPGTPAVTTSPADAAAGMSWLNYGLLAGGRHCFYGVELGPLKWLYVAPDNVVWLASLAWSGVNAATINLAPLFGTAPTQSIAVTCAPTLVSPALAVVGEVMDIAQNGRAVVFLLKKNNRTDEAHDPQAMMLLEIDGIVPAASATLSLLFEKNRSGYNGLTETDSQVVTYTETRNEVDKTTNPWTTRSFTVTWDQPRSDLMQPPPWVPSPPWEIGGSLLSEKRINGTWLGRFLRGYVFVDNTRVEVTEVYREVMVGYGYTDDGSYTTDGSNKTYSGAQNIDQWLEIGTASGAQMPTHMVFSGRPEGTVVSGIPGAAYSVHPLTNRLWSMVETGSDQNGGVSFYPPLSPVGQSSGSKITVPYNNGAFPASNVPFATYHPVTQAVVFHSVNQGVVCWV